MPPEYASVGISPPYQEAAPGTPISFSVSGMSTMGGTISISVPTAMNLVGDPVCHGPCSGPFVRTSSGTTLIEVTLDGESAVVGFTVSVSTIARPGDTLNINAMLVGGPDAVEMASASVQVMAPVANQNPLPDDNRLLYLQVNPQYLRIAPSGEALFHIQPVRWGMWSGPSPNVAVNISIPAGVTPTSNPSCGRGDQVPTQAPCSVTTTEESDGSTTYSITPGYNIVDETTNGIYLYLKAERNLEVGTILQVNVSATVDDSTLPEQPIPVTSTLHVVDKESLLTLQRSEEEIGAVLELQDGYSTTGQTCSFPASDTQLGLYEYGLNTRYSKATYGTGQLGSATDGSRSEVCHLPVLFANVPSKSIYILASAYGDDLPCRACVYGFITPTRGAEIVFANP
jgi:hypothetical protein